MKYLLILMFLLGTMCKTKAQVIPVFPEKTAAAKKTVKPVRAKAKPASQVSSTPKTVQQPESGVVYSVTMHDAEYPGGNEAWAKFLQQNLNANIPADNGAKPGTYKVVVQFNVSVNGEVSEIQATTNCGYGMEAEVKRVIALTRWFPGSQNGRAVAMRKTQSVSFTITE